METFRGGIRTFVVYTTHLYFAQHVQALHRSPAPRTLEVALRAELRGEHDRAFSGVLRTALA